MRQHEAQWPDNVGRRAQQHFPFDQRLADQSELVIFEVPQAAMDELAGTRTRSLRQVVLLAQHDTEAAAGGVAGNSGAVDAAADDEKIDQVGWHHALAALRAALAGDPAPVAAERLGGFGDLGFAQQHRAADRQREIVLPRDGFELDREPHGLVERGAGRNHPVIGEQAGRTGSPRP